MLTLSYPIDFSHLPSHYTEKHLDNLQNSMPVSLTLAMGLNVVAQKEEVMPKGPSIFLLGNASLKEALEKFELEKLQDYQSP